MSFKNQRSNRVFLITVWHKGKRLAWVQEHQYWIFDNWKKVALSHILFSSYPWFLSVWDEWKYSCQARVQWNYLSCFSTGNCIIIVFLITYEYFLNFWFSALRLEISLWFPSNTSYFPHYFPMKFSAIHSFHLLKPYCSSYTITLNSLNFIAYFSYSNMTAILVIPTNKETHDMNYVPYTHHIRYAAIQSRSNFHLLSLHKYCFVLFAMKSRVVTI